MAIFPNKTFIAYARPTRERPVREVLNDRAAARLTVPAFAYSLANAQPNNVEAQLNQLSNQVTTRLLLPDIDLLPPRQQPKTPRHDYTTSIESFTSTAAQATPWLTKVVNAQVDGGATAVVTPSLFLEQAHGDVELRRMLEWADAVRGLKKLDGRPVITGLTLHRTWLMNDAKRETLLNILTDSEDAAFYLVVRWPAPAQSRAQTADLTGLMGYREVIEVLRANDREVIVGRSGLADYVLAGVGANAHLDGVSASHVHRDEVQIRRAKGSHPPARISHYLDGRLFGLVPASQLAGLQAVTGPKLCICSYCAKIKLNAFDDHLSDKHQLALNANLVDALNASGNARTLVASNVAQAITLAANHGAGLPAYTTGHLKAWANVLS